MDESPLPFTVMALSQLVIQKLRRLFQGDIRGHSLHTGGATALAEAGISPHLIQAMAAFQLYTFDGIACFSQHSFIPNHVR